MNPQPVTAAAEPAVGTRRPTIRTIAREAGVSIATVSYVLNDRDLTDPLIRVATATRERVLAAAGSLGYEPDQSARGMRTGRTGQICLVISSVDSPWAQAMVEAMTRTSREAGLTLLVLVDGDWLSFLTRRGADGAVIASAAFTDDEVARVRTLGEQGLALVAIEDRIEPSGGFDVVRQDQGPALTASLELLAGRHERIACFYNGGNSESLVRLAAFRSTLGAAGLEVDDRLLRDTGASRERAYREMLALFAGDDPPTALFATHDLAGIGALWACYRQGIEVPTRFEIIGSGNTPEGQRTDPPLTSVGPTSLHQDVADLLMRRLRHPDLPGDVHHSAWLLHHRGTTRPDIDPDSPPARTIHRGVHHD